MNDYSNPLELWLEEEAQNPNFFPVGHGNYFDRYKMIKQYCIENCYKYIGAATSAEDQGIYTDHSIDHFNAVIRYAGKLLGLEAERESSTSSAKLELGPYEIFILLTSILLHDAGNIFGRQGHEKNTLNVFKDMGVGLYADQFEANIIAKIAQAHGGKTAEGSKDTIRKLLREDKTSYISVVYRPRVIAAIVRFADEICEDRSRAARYLLAQGKLPSKSEIYHCYANSISSVEVDRSSKRISVKYELSTKDVKNKQGKDGGKGFLIDEINIRLEKMYCELCYSKQFFYEFVPINEIRATVLIYDEDNNNLVEQQVFELKDRGYPVTPFAFASEYPQWSGKAVKKKLSKANGRLI